jgi:DNA-binding Lrp family transcriptional regulator
MKVCRNLWYDHARKRKFLTDADLPERIDPNTPETLLLQKEESAALWRAMAKLDKADRELLVLHYFAARPLGELASLLGLTNPAARQRLHRAEVTGRICVIVSVDRMERGSHATLCARAEIERDTGVPVVPLVNFEDIVQAIACGVIAGDADAMRKYAAQYGEVT